MFQNVPARSGRLGIHSYAVGCSGLLAHASRVLASSREWLNTRVSGKSCSEPKEAEFQVTTAWLGS